MTIKPLLWSRKSSSSSRSRQEIEIGPAEIIFFKSGPKIHILVWELGTPQMSCTSELKIYFNDEDDP